MQCAEAASSSWHSHRVYRAFSSVRSARYCKNGNREGDPARSVTGERVDQSSTRWSQLSHEAASKLIGHLADEPLRRVSRHFAEFPREVRLVVIMIVEFCLEQIKRQSFRPFAVEPLE